MPEHRGKKRRKPRSRGGGAQTEEAPTAGAVPVRPVRRGWQGPPWLNLTLGVFMLVAGVYFFLFVQKGMDLTARVVLLVAYIAIAAFYFFRAYKGYRARAPGG
jgi:hypothetical protein